MTTGKQLSTHNAIAFFELLAKRHPEIDSQLPSKNLVDNCIVCFKPAKMPTEAYEIYERFLKRWYMDNGFMEAEPDLVFVSTTDQKGMALDTSLIDSITIVDMELTKVVMREKEGDFKNTIIIKENRDDFKKRVYIF